MSRLAHAAAAARDLLPAGVCVAAEDPKAPDLGLWPEEAAMIAAAVPRRRREFAAGRRAGRRAMAALGLPPAGVPMGPDRAPLWPAGIAGSISHTRDCCLAALTRTGPVCSVGLDLEMDLPLEAGIWDSICTVAELDWLRTQPVTERGHLVRRIFSVKECIYKVQYPLTRTVLGFDAATVAVGAVPVREKQASGSPAAATAAALVSGSGLVIVDLFTGRDRVRLAAHLACTQGLVITAATVGSGVFGPPSDRSRGTGPGISRC